MPDSPKSKNAQREAPPDKPKFTPKGPDSKEKDAVLDQFRRFDTNNDGAIAKTELVQVLLGLNPNFTADQMDALFDEIDENHDGKVSVQEFMTWIFGGSAASVEVSTQGLIKALEAMSKLIDKHAGDEEATFLAKVPFPEAMDFKVYCKKFEAKYDELHKEAAKNKLGGQPEAQVQAAQKKDFADYTEKYNLDAEAAKGGKCVLQKMKVAEREGGWNKVNKLASNGADVVKFISKGGAIPKAFEERLLGPRCLVSSWKHGATKGIFAGGYLVTKQKPGAIREAVYVLGAIRSLDCSVTVLPGVKYKPELVAEKDSKGGHTLQLNAAQKPFDLLKPNQIAQLCVELTNEMDMVISMLSTKATTIPAGHTQSAHHENIFFGPE